MSTSGYPLESIAPLLPTSTFSAVLPAAITHALDAMQDTLLQWQGDLQAQMDSLTVQLDATRGQLESLNTEMDAARVELGQTRQDRDRWRAQADRHQQDRDHWHVEADQYREDRDRWKQDAERHQQDRDRWQAEAGKHESRCHALAEQLEAEGARNRGLNQKLMELYRIHQAQTDLPQLTLQISMSLVNAESGVFLDATGQKVLARAGTEDLAEEVRDALHGYARKAVESEEPIVRNDSASLPDGPNLVNMAALPVVVQGQKRGAIVVANKRTGPFTDEDTRTLLSIGEHAGIALENGRLHAALGEAYLSTIAVMADAIECKDPYTRGHCEQVSEMAVQVAERLGWNEETVEEIRYAGLLHDVGKIGVPDGILLKPGRLLPEEFQVIKAHSSIGRDLVSRVPSLQHIAPIILHHHEWIDGGGYPAGLQGEDIPLAARIIGVVDALNAMTSPRPYRNPLSLDQALDELHRCSGSQFDPQIVSLISQVIAEEHSVVGSGR